MLKEASPQSIMAKMAEGKKMPNTYPLKNATLHESLNSALITTAVSVKHEAKPGQRRSIV
jgi:hypothetical protein